MYTFVMQSPTASMQLNACVHVVCVCACLHYYIHAYLYEWCVRLEMHTLQFACERYIEKFAKLLCMDQK